MEHNRRFIFHGHAAAFGGHIIRPKDIVLEASGASALPFTGGRSVAKLGRTQFGDLFHVESAATFAEGLFENRDHFLAVTHKKMEEHALTAATHVWADVSGFAVGRKPRLTIAHIRAELSARSPLGSGEPSVRVGDKSAIAGVDIDGHRLIVEVDTRPFHRCDTHAKLLVAADDPEFVKESGAALFMTTTVNDRPAPANGRLITCHDTIFATIVKSIRWDGDPFPGATIDHNLVVVPNFGRIYFGELLICSRSRRLCMVRLSLGSDTGGSASAADVQDNGMWS